MSAGYVVRWASGAKLCVDTLGEAQQLLREAGEGAYVLRLDDGREERLPSYEEALGEIDRLRAVETVVIAACETFERFESGGERPSRGELGDMVSAMRAALGGQSVQSADPLAALEAAERRLLEAGGWTPGDRGFWVDPCDGTQWPRAGAVDFERKRPSRLAAKGGA